MVPARQDDDGPAQAEESEPYDSPLGAWRISWTRLLKCVFEIDSEHRPNCGGELKLIAAILETQVLERSIE